MLNETFLSTLLYLYLMKLFSITYITSKLDKSSNILRIYLVYRLQLINAQLVNEQMKSLILDLVTWYHCYVYQIHL